jgi:hypothetical protein
MTDTPSAVRKSLSPLVIALAALVISLAVAAIVLVRLIGDSDPTRTVFQHPDFDVYGSIELNDGYNKWEPDTPCAAKSGYDDVQEGTEVVISDAAGTTLAVGQLEAGKVVRSEAGFNVCEFRFQVSGVPGGHSTYRVEISDRGDFHYNQDEMTRGVVLYLGF